MVPDEQPHDPVIDRVYADGVAMVQLLGPQDRLLRVVEKEHPGVDVHVRGNEITLTGEADAVAAARSLVDELLAMTKAGQGLDPADVSSSSRILRTEGGPRPSEVLGEAILSSRGKVIRPKTLGQKAYVDAIEENTIVFGIGPAGTGKTYLAMAKAVQAQIHRPLDLLSRYGGEEFAALLYDVNNAQAREVAERMRLAVSALAIEHRGSRTARVVTVSIGVASIQPLASRGPLGALQLADEALYAAKVRGRDNVHLAAESEYSDLETGVFAQQSIGR